jgi:pilus assembly protein CpaB
MKRRVIGIAVALLLATVGTIALVAYVNKAKDDAVKEEAQVQLLVVTDTIRQGATIGEIKQRTTLTEVPKRLAAPDAVTDLTTVDPTLVAGVELVKGDQLVSSRLVDARSLVRVAVPAGLQEITIALSPERAVGADLQAGDTVGVIFSFDPFDITSTGAPAAPETTIPGGTTDTTVPTKTPNTTHLTLHKILVTGVQLSKSDRESASAIQGTPNAANSTDTTIAAANVAQAPADQLLVTLAVSAPEAEQIVFASEFGYIWLTAEGANASEDGTRILTLAQVYVPVPRS